MLQLAASDVYIIILFFHYTNGYLPAAEAGDDQLSNFLALDDTQQGQGILKSPANRAREVS